MEGMIGVALIAHPMKTIVLVTGLCASLFVCSAPADAQQYKIETSKYWCDKLQGSYAGGNCSASYEARPAKSCQTFKRTVTDPELLQRLAEIESARICLADHIDAAKVNTLKLRIRLRGYVTAGLDETVNDPVKDLSFQPTEGKATFATAAAYFLHECVIETCLQK